MYQTLELQEQTGILQVSLNRPEVKNAMNLEMIEELKRVFSNPDPALRVIVLKGNGDVFCAGGDLNWMKSSVEKSPEENKKDAEKLGAMLRALNECPIPVVTQVKGGAYGGGVGLVAASDIVIADEKARFSLSEVKLGLIPATIGPIVMRKIGISQARRLYLTGQRFSAYDALQMNLVHQIGPVSSFLSLTNEVVREFETAGPEAVKRAKKLIFELQAGDLWKEDIAEKTSQVLSEVRVQPEAQEGLRAFLEKRPASWRTKLLP